MRKLARHGVQSFVVAGVLIFAAAGWPQQRGGPPATTESPDELLQRLDDALKDLAPASTATPAPAQRAAQPPPTAVSPALRPGEAASTRLAYFGLLPGKSNKADVDLLLGDPKSEQEGRLTYSPSIQATDTERIEVNYLKGSRTLYQLEIVLKKPAGYGDLARRAGQRVLMEKDESNRVWEYRTPGFLALGYTESKDGGPPLLVERMRYVSPQYLADRFIARGDTAAREKKLDDALTEYEKATRIDSEYAVPYLKMAAIHIRNKARDKALLYYTAATKAAYPVRAKAAGQYYIGVIHNNDKQPELALKAFNRALAEDSSYAGGHLGIGLIHQQRNQWKEAMAAYTKAVAADPGWNLASHKLAFTKLHLHDFTAAEKESRRRLEVQPKDRVAMVYLAAALASQVTPKDPIVAFFQEESRLKEALSWLDKAVTSGYANKEWLEKTTYLRQVREQESQAFNEILSKIRMP